jgi:hypothetical protein
MMLRLVSALTIFGITAALIGSIAFAQTPPFWVFSPTPFIDRGAEKQRTEQKKVVKNGPAVKNRLRHKK